MRSVLFASVFALAAHAASSDSQTYSNTLTNFLTETDSRGVVTGQPTADASTPTQPAVATDVGTVGQANTNVGTAATDLGSLATNIGTLPPGDFSVAYIPPGISPGMVTLTYGRGSTASKITASIGSKTTVIETSAPASTTSSSSGGSSSTTTDASDNSSAGANAAQSSSSSTSDSAAAATNIQIAGGALLGAAGIAIALL